MTIVHSGPAVVTAALLRQSGITVKIADTGLDLLFLAASRPESVILVDFDSSKFCGLRLLQELWSLGRQYAVYSLSGSASGKEVKVFSNSLDIQSDRGMLIRDLVQRAAEANDDQGKQSPVRV